MAPAREIYRVKWNNFTGVLRSNLRRYLQDESFTDVTLACEGQRIKCHRIILSSASEYFDSLLNSNEFPDTTNTIIYLKDVKFWELKVLIEYLYNGEITISEEKLRRVSAIAESLRIKGFAGEEGVIDEDIAKDLGLTNVRTRPPPTPTLQTQQPMQSQRLENALKRKAPLVTSPPKLIKIQKPGETMTPRPNQANFNGLSNKVKLPRDPMSEQLRQDRILVMMEQKSEVEDQRMKIQEDDGIPEGEIVDDDENELEIAEVETSLEETPITSESDSEEDDVSGKDDIEMLRLETHTPGGSAVHHQRKSVYKYSQEVRDGVLSALQTGMSLRQCSDSFGIPRKTISKWKQRELEDANNEIPIELLPISQIKMEDDGSRRLITVQAPKRRGPGVSIDSGDRAERLEAAMKLALSGTTVRQAAVTYEIPRTTLCAYMKRKGVQAKRNFSASGGLSSFNSSMDDFPFLGLSDLIDDVDAENDYGEEEDELY